jgi:hypothetical protein
MATPPRAAAGGQAVAVGDNGGAFTDQQSQRQPRVALARQATQRVMDRSLRTTLRPADALSSGVEAQRRRLQWRQFLAQQSADLAPEFLQLR